MSVRVKICGITSAQDAEVAVRSGADAIGFIFYPKSPRFVEPETVAAIVGTLPPFVTPVGVFVNEPTDRLRDIVEGTGLRAVQLQGDELPEACVGLPVPVIRALGIGPNFDVESLKKWPVGTFHLDTAKPGSYGGTGETFDWAIAGKAAAAHRIVLAGGLTPDNVTEAVHTVRPYAVDTSSGVEASPGIKDPAKVAAFIKAAKQALNFKP